MRVVIEICSTCVHLQVPNHVEQDKAHHCDAGSTHDVLLAHRGGIEVEKERTTLPLGSSGPCDGASLARDYLCHILDSLPTGQPSGAIALETVPPKPPWAPT